MALTANELRIGNKVYYTVSNTGKKFIGEITKVWKSDNGMTGTIDCHYPLSFGEPIPLSPEILGRCGFKWNDGIDHWVINWGRNGVHFIKKDSAYIGYSFELGKHHYKVVEYLHELMNLFYSLTGEELIFKP